MVADGQQWQHKAIINVDVVFSLFQCLCQMPISTSYLMSFLCYPGTSSFPAFSLFSVWLSFCNEKSVDCAIMWSDFVSFFFPERKKMQHKEPIFLFLTRWFVLFIWFLSFLFPVHCVLVSIADYSRRVLSWQICHVYFLPFFLFFGGIFSSFSGFLLTCVVCFELNYFLSFTLFLVDDVEWNTTVNVDERRPKHALI